MANHLLTELQQENVVLVHEAKREPIRSDDAVQNILDAALESTLKKKRSWISLPNATCQIPLFSALSLAWHLHVKPNPGIVVYATKDPLALQFAHGHALPAKILPKGHHNLLKVVRVSDRIEHMSARLAPKRWEFQTRMVIVEQVTAELLTRLEEAGSPPIYGIIDGRTVEVDDAELPRDMHWCRLDPCSLRRSKPWRLVKAKRCNGSGNPGLLSLDDVRLEEVSSVSSPDPCQELWSLLYALHRAHVDSVALAEAWHITWLLASLPIRPSELGRQFVGGTGFVGNPIRASLSVLDSLAAGTKDGNADLEHFIHEAHQACASLESQASKRDAILASCRLFPKSLVLVRGKAVQEGLERILQSEGLVDCRVMTWNDPATWMPFDGNVIVASSPPKGRAWLIASDCSLGRRVEFHLTRPEAQRLRRALLDLGVKEGVGLDFLNSSITENPSQAEEFLDELPMDLSEWLPATTSHGSSRTTMPGKSRCIFLEDGSRVFVASNARVAKVIQGGVTMVQPHQLRSQNMVLLPADPLETDIKKAAYRAFEAHEPEARALYEKWKDLVVERIDASDPETVRQEFRVAGADLTPEQFEAIFVRRGSPDEQWSTRDRSQLATASQTVLQSKVTARDIESALSRLHGLHTLAGKFLQQYARLDFFGTLNDWNQYISPEYGITRADVVAAVQPVKVTAVSSPFTFTQSTSIRMESSSQ